MNRLYAAIAGATAVMMIFHGGRVYERGVAHEAQITQLKGDAVRADAIAVADTREKARIVERIKTVEKLVPADDCYHRPVPAAILDGLRDTGLRPRSAPDG